jgi:transcriptional regulator with GAF, ATPase, and Fis domain
MLEPGLTHVSPYPEDPESGAEAVALTEQQAATSEILRVISRSPADVQPVFDALVKHALRLCDASFAFVMLHDKGKLTLVARTACKPEFAEYLAHGFEVNRETTTGRAAIERKPVQVIDFMAEPGMRVLAAHVSEGMRTVLAVPMLQDERLLGVIVTWRREVRPFKQRQIELLHTFADQAVIALDNARLFRQVEARNRELTETLEQQAATSAILRAISQSPTDVQPVFDTIAEAAMRLCNARSANVFTFDGELLHAAAIHVDVPGGVEAIGRAFPRPPDRGTAASRAVLTGSMVVIHDVLEDDDYALVNAPAWGFRSVLGVPLLRDGVPIGAMALGRSEPGPFPDKQIALVQTFADQAVIAIENVRLFHALEEKSRQLEIASRHKSIFLANMSHELRTPLNAIIGFTRIVMRRSQERLEPKQYENLEKILTSGQNLLSLINAILDLAKVEAGRIDITARDVQPASVLEQCVRTGAIQQRRGRFELAHGGTLFMDEVGELPLETQAKLLRVLQEREFERVGGTKGLHVDVRVIAATNRDLNAEVRASRFRADLYFRLAVFPIALPPLRERREDIPLLLKHFSERMARKLGRTFEGISPTFLERAGAYAWPGNVRELENAVERALIMSPGGLLDSSESLVGTPGGASHEAPALPGTLEEMERAHIRRALNSTRWRIEGDEGAARILGLNPSTLRGRMRKLGISRTS